MNLRQATTCGLSGIIVLLALSASAQKDVQPQEPTVMTEFRQALSLSERGDDAHALAATQELLKRHPLFAPALKLQGMLLENSGQADAAEQSYEKGLKLAPNDADLLYKVGVHRLLEGKRDAAIPLLVHSLKVEPNDGDALYYLAQAYHLDAQDDRAMKAIKECLKYKPGDPSVWQKYGELLSTSGNSKEGFAWLQKARNADPSLELIDYDLAVASMDNMDFQNAATYSERAVEKQPHGVDALQLYASAETRLSQWQKALAAFDRILAAKPDDPDALLGKGRALSELKHFEDAVETLHRLLVLDPANAQAHYYLSRAYAGLGNVDEAQHQADLHQRLTQLTSFAPSGIGTKEEIAELPQARQLLTEHHEKDALKLFGGKNPAAVNAHSLVLVGALYLSLGDTADGVGELHHALKIQPTVRGAHTYLGMVALQQGKLDEAEKEFAAEIANDPNYELAVANMGMVRYRQRRWADAADELAKSRTRMPALLFALCDSYFRLGKIHDADVTAEIAAAYSRNDPAMTDGLLELLKRNGRTELVERLAGSAKP